MLLVASDGPLIADDFILTSTQAFTPHEAASHSVMALAEVSLVRRETLGQIHLV